MPVLLLAHAPFPTAGNVPLVQCHTAETWQSSQLAWSVFYVQLYRSLKQLVDTYVAHTIKCLQPGHVLTFLFFPFQTVTDRGSFCSMCSIIIWQGVTTVLFLCSLPSFFVLCWLFPLFILCCSFLYVVSYIYQWLWRLLTSNLLVSVSNPLWTFLEPQSFCIASTFKRAWLNTVVHLSTIKVWSHSHVTFS